MVEVRPIVEQGGLGLGQHVSMADKHKVKYNPDLSNDTVLLLRPPAVSGDRKQALESLPLFQI